MKIATWNVNGIRAREAQLQELIEEEQPGHPVPAGDQGVAPTASRLALRVEGYWCYWHGGKGYSGVALHVAEGSLPERPRFEHPAFDDENRIVTVRLGGVTVASIYVPNGGKDFPARCASWRRSSVRRGARRRGAAARALRGSQRRAHRHGRAPEGAEAAGIGQLPEERALLERIIGHGLVDVQPQLEPDNADCSRGGRRGGT